jgi:hypothetical protein
MKPNPAHLGKSPRFWAYAKFISELLGYSVRKTGQLRTYELPEVMVAMQLRGLTPDQAILSEAIAYLNWRTGHLNGHVSGCFMNRDQAAAEFQRLKDNLKPTRASAMNKQKGEKKHPAYLSGMVSMIAESVLGPDGFIDDARRLSFVSEATSLEEIFSRRFDGAIPSTENPRAVWEIKEYYATTTFGSRVADGVYETLLDGYEIEGVRSRMGRDIAHFLFIDDKFTWWDCGRSYLCRMVDMLHTRHVDEIFFGREVLTDWQPRLLTLKK